MTKTEDNPMHLKTREPLRLRQAKTVSRYAASAARKLASFFSAHRKVGSERARGMNDALHGREA
jgi:hypothetical protein